MDSTQEKGAVTHVGKSSMEIQIEVFSKQPNSENQQKMIEALFSMVARGPTGKAAEGLSFLFFSHN
jgi:acyl-CoA hydrolase